MPKDISRRGAKLCLILAAQGVDRAFGARGSSLSSFTTHPVLIIAIREIIGGSTGSTTAGEGYARCMPYFHYPPQFYRGPGGSLMK